LILTISGASGVGKDTLVNYLFETVPNLIFLPSYTTREKRAGDRGYVYVSNEIISEMENKKLLAWPPVGPFGHRYATLASDVVNSFLDKKNIWVTILVPETVEKLRSLEAARVLSVYLYCKDNSILRERLIRRGDKDVEKRMKDCSSWNEKASKHWFFKWLDTSGNIEQTMNEMMALLKDRDFIK